MERLTLLLCVVILSLSFLNLVQLQQCIQQYSNRIDVSLNKEKCNMTSNYAIPRNCNVVINGQCTDGYYYQGKCIMTEESLRDREPRWTVDLEQEYTIQMIIVTSRGDYYGRPRTPFTEIWVDNVMVYKYPATVPTRIRTDISRSTPGSRLPAKGRFVSLSRRENNFDFDGEKILLTFCKLEVWVCRPGHYGEDCTACGPACTDQFCDEINKSCSGPCNSRTCQNGGTCTSDYSVNYTCTCPPGFSGAQCQTDVTGTQKRDLSELTGPIVGAILGAGALIGLCVLIGICWKRRVVQSGRSENSTTVTGNSSLSTTGRQHSEEVVYAISQDPETEGSLHIYDHAQFNADDGQHTYYRLETPETDYCNQSTARIQDKI